MKIKSQKISQNLALNKLIIERDATILHEASGKNVIFAIDVSGSMYSSLAKMRQQLKNKIPDIIGAKDTITLIWFSGRGQAGILKEGVEIKNLEDLKKLNDAIDRFLQPIGLTAFLPPLQLTRQVVENLKTNKKDFSFIFLSDGYNNDSAWPEVITELEKLDSHISAATFIEYGYYADSNALTEMAETIGGEKIFAKDFDSYEQSFDKIINKETSQKISYDISEIKSKLSYQFFFAINDDETTAVYSSKNKNEILIPEDIQELFFFTQYRPIGSIEFDFTSTYLLVAAYILADRLKYKHVEDILISVGDVRLLNDFSGAYGKQKLNQLKDEINSAAFDLSKMYIDGQTDSYKIDPKQYCVMDLINDLQKGENFFYPYNPDFNYNRIGQKKTTKTELDEATKEALFNAKSIKEAKLITENVETAEFIYPSDAATRPSSFNTLVWNSTRANLSVQTVLEGKVKLPKNSFGLTEVDSKIFRTYNLIKDGILNITEIPVSLDEETFFNCEAKGLIDSNVYIHNKIYILNLSSLPTINRSMTVNVSAKKLANLEFDLIQTQLGQKYLKSLKEQYDPKTNFISSQKYSAGVAEWLKSIGIDDQNGFSPKTEVEKSEDFYIAPELKTKIEKTSTSPKISDVFAKIEAIENKVPKAKELNVMETIMKSEINSIGDFKLAHISKSDDHDEEVDIDGLNIKLKEYDLNRRNLLYEIARIKFGLILSRTWFTEFDSIEQNELHGVKFKGVPQPLDVKFDFIESQIKI